jgi:hypothetical protein
MKTRKERNEIEFRLGSAINADPAGGFLSLKDP